MPTFFRSAPFLQDWRTLTPDQKARFKAAVWELVDGLRTGRGFRPGLRVKRVQKVKGIFEMAWAPDGRATFEYGLEVRPGDPHILWRRIGSHVILNNP